MLLLALLVDLNLEKDCPFRERMETRWMLFLSFLSPSFFFLLPFALSSDARFLQSAKCRGEGWGESEQAGSEAHSHLDKRNVQKQFFVIFRSLGLFIDESLKDLLQLRFFLFLSLTSQR